MTCIESTRAVKSKRAEEESVRMNKREWVGRC